MKRTKLLFPLLTCLSLTPVVTVAACGNTKSTSEYVAEYIINPSKLTQKVALPKSTFKESLKSLSADDLKKELIYDIFHSFNDKGKYGLKAEDSFGSLYESNKVGIRTNITKCGLEFKDDGKFMCYFLGYVSFVFLSDYSDMYKQDNYVMLTFDIQEQEVTIDENNCSLFYKATSPFENPCLGFAKVKYSGSKEVMQYIETIDTNTYSVKNCHN